MKQIIKSVLLTVVMCIFSLTVTAAKIKPATTASQPDFAFPEKVSATALKDLDAAMKKHDNAATVRSLMEYYLALTVKNPEDAQKGIDKILSVIDKTTDAGLRAMLNALIANIYNQIYSSNSWQYDRRELPLTPRDADFNKWSGEQFKACVTEYIEASLADPDALKAISLREYDPVITSDAMTFVYLPTLYDFIAQNAISVYERFDEYLGYVPEKYLSSYNMFVAMKFDLPSTFNNRILALYASLITFHLSDTPALIYADLNRLRYVSSLGYSEDSSYLKALKDLYFRFADSEYSGEILLECDEAKFMYYICHDSEKFDELKWFYDAIKSNLRRFPSFYSAGCLEEKFAKMAEKKIEVLCPDFVRPGTEIYVKATVINQNDVILDIYKLTDVDPSNLRERERELSDEVEKLKPIKTLSSVIPDTVPFSKEVSFKVTFPDDGFYVIVPRMENHDDMELGSVITVSKLALLTTTFLDTKTVFSIDPLDSAPISGAEIFFESGYEEYEKIGMTDKSGRLDISNVNIFWELYAKHGNSYSTYTSLNNGYDSPNKYIRAKILTDLALYHPGDTVSLTAICYDVYIKDVTLKDNISIKTTISRPDGNSDTIIATTDSWGRAQMKYVIPESTMTGQYYLSVIDPKASGSGSFTVSDYKLPSFEIKLDKPQINTPAHHDATVSGQVMTYSGFPLANSKITLSLESVSRRGYFPWLVSRGQKVYGAETMTNESGKFEIVISASVFNSISGKGNIYVANVQATSAAGESHSDRTNFTFTDFYAIKIESLKKNINASESLKIQASVVDFNGRETGRPLEVTLLANGDSIVMPLPSDGKIDLSDVKSGPYKLTVSCPDFNDVTPFTTKVVIYRPTDKESPTPDDFIWTPDRKFDLSSDRQLTWLFASNCPTRLLVIINSEKILLEKWIDVNRGMNRFHWQMPDSINEAIMTVAGFGNCKTYKNKFEITAPEQRIKLKIKAESFRDKVISGQDETWTFSVVDSENNPREAAVLLDMYNKALDAISSHSFSLYPDFSKLPRSWFDFSRISHYYAGTSAIQEVDTDCKSLLVPEFDSFGMPLYNFNPMNGLRIRGSYAKQTLNEVEFEEGELCEYVVDEAVIGYGASSISADKIEEVEEEAADAGANDNEVNNNSGNNFSFRQSEVPLAFYAPDLTTDSEGRLSFSFKVPDANTTWNFNAIAYTDRLLTASFDATVLASKPVMVKPNLPRFIRIGDSATVNATVMNNTAEAAKIGTTVEIFNPADGRIISSRHFENDIDSMGSVTVSVNLDGMDGMAFIGYRVKSSTETFADGEQSLIPVLPSQTPVIESKPFCLAPDEKQFSMEIPAFGADARLTLQYCENPVWYVVTALPGLMKYDASTANQAAAAIFSASVARGLIDANPEIEKALKGWLASEKSDSTLTSMLNRNSDLKMMLLNATPWMMDAAGDTERMSRLALLFDRKEINRVIETNAELLTRLQRDGGGWAWMEQMDNVSDWSTMNVLLLFGHLRQLGFMPDNKSLEKGVEAGIGYIDSVTAKDFEKYPKADYFLYAYVRSFFPDMELSVASKSVIAGTVNSVIRTWKKHTPFIKAVDALILNRYSYPTVARNILSSLDEYSVYSPDKGMYWPSIENQSFWSMDKLGTTAIILNAYREVDPESVSIDRITQWMVLQKEAMDWGNSTTTTQVIASMLNSARKWLRPALATEVKIGSEEVVAESVEKVTGSFRTDVTAQARPGSILEINRDGDTPAWGALTAQFKADLTDVKAASVKDLSIEKRLLRYNITPTGQTVETAEELAVGDKIRVELTITAGRDMDYVAIIDERAAGFEPVEQLPQPIFSEGIFFYRENRDSESRIFVGHLPKGTYILTYDVWVNNAGLFTSGVAKIQSQYTPSLTAHSSSHALTVRP